MIEQNFEETLKFLRSKTDMQPEIGLVLGSGLGGLAVKIENKTVIDYADIPHFLSSTAPGHAGKLIFGELSGKRIVCMQGRFHFYEGYDLKDIVYPIRIMKLLGVKALLLSNAAGGINKEYNVGDFMIIKDHINFLGDNPLRGGNVESLGERFPDMGSIYSMRLRKIAAETAAECDTKIHEGIFIACLGPSYETPAEIRAFRILGADAVGMSTVPEVICASHCGLEVLAISLITNMAAGILDEPLSGEEVIIQGQLSAADFQKFVSDILKKI